MIYDNTTMLSKKNQPCHKSLQLSCYHHITFLQYIVAGEQVLDMFSLGVFAIEQG